jgi:hypothetical protein
MAHLDPAQSHDLAQVAQGQPVAQPAEHDEGNDVALQLVELPTAVPAAEAAIAARRHLRPLRHRHGLTPHAVHLDTPPGCNPIDPTPGTQDPSNRPPAPGVTEP